MSVFVSVTFFMFIFSKGHSVKAYLGPRYYLNDLSPVQHHLNCNLWPTQNPHQKCNIRLDLELQFFFCTYLENCSIQLSFVFSLDQTRPRSDRDWWAGVDWLQRLRNLWWHQVGWENENYCILGWALWNRRQVCRIRSVNPISTRGGTLSPPSI